MKCALWCRRTTGLKSILGFLDHCVSGKQYPLGQLIPIPWKNLIMMARVLRLENKPLTNLSPGTWCSFVHTVTGSFSSMGDHQGQCVPVWISLELKNQKDRVEEIAHLTPPCDKICGSKKQHKNQSTFFRTLFILWEKDLNFNKVRKH